MMLNAYGVEIFSDENSRELDRLIKEFKALFWYMETPLIKKAKHKRAGSLTVLVSGLVR